MKRGCARCSWWPILDPSRREPSRSHEGRVGPSAAQESRDGVDSDKHTIGPWAPPPQHEPPAVPDLNHCIRVGTACDKGVWPFEDPAVNGRNAQIAAIRRGRGRTSQIDSEALAGSTGRRSSVCQPRTWSSSTFYATMRRKLVTAKFVLTRLAANGQLGQRSTAIGASVSVLRSGKRRPSSPVGG